MDITVIIILLVSISMSVGRDNTEDGWLVPPKCGEQYTETDDSNSSGVARVGEFPWMISLQVRGQDGNFKHICSGSLVGQGKVIVTSGSCVWQLRNAGYSQGVYGCVDLTSSTCKTVRLHPDQDRMYYYTNFKLVPPTDLTKDRGDFGFLRLSNLKYLTYDGVTTNTLCLHDNAPDYETLKAAGSPGIHAGWGPLPPEDVVNSKILRYYKTTIMLDCPLRQTPKAFCAAGPSGAACKGDEGSPIIVKSTAPGTAGKYHLIGVVSELDNDKKCVLGEPNVYARVEQFWNWFINTIVEVAEG